MNIGKRTRRAAVAVLGAAALVGYVLGHRKPAVSFVTAPVTRGSIVRGVSASGTVNPVVTEQIRSDV